MKKFSFIFTLIIFAFFAEVNAQNEAAIWYFGENAGLDFSSGTPATDNDGVAVFDLSTKDSELLGLQFNNQFNTRLLSFTVRCGKQH